MQSLTLSFDDPSALTFVLATALIAGLVRGFSGFGGPAIMILVLSLFYAPASVIAKVLVMDMVASVHLLRGTFAQANWRNTLMMTLGTVIAMPFGLWALYFVDPVVARRIVAIVVTVCTLAMFAGWRFSTIPSQVVWFGFGLLAGTIGGLTGIAMLGMVFLFAMPERATASRANAVAWLFAVSPFFLIAHAVGGTLTLDALWRAAAVGLVYTAGAHLGAKGFKRASEGFFRHAVGVLLVTLSAAALVS
jgi:uncharacterized protein